MNVSAFYGPLARQDGTVAATMLNMRDPHVERLHFRIEPPEGVRYDNPQPLTFTNNLGRFDAREGSLTVEPVDHFASQKDALAALEPFLREWEISAALDANAERLHFAFVRAEVVDRAPSPTAHVMVAEPGGMLIVGGEATFTVTKRSYPPPPAAFRLTPEVQQAYGRWRDYRAGRERLLPTGYFVLTVAERLAGDRKAAARTFNIEEGVLHKFGELTSTKGDAASARKAPKHGQFAPLSGEEEAWLHETIRRVIKRLGEHASGAPLALLRMSDLPPL